MAAASASNMWDDLLRAVALILVIEGIMPFVNPGGLRNSLVQIARMPDRALRAIGLGSMAIGVLLLYLTRL